MRIRDIESTLQHDAPGDRVKDLMTLHPTCGSPDATIHDIARKMMDADCGEIPICAGERLIGVVTDRDIACRAIAEGRDPDKTRADQVMTTMPAVIGPDAPLDEAIDLMERHRIRRLPVVDQQGHVVGIVSMTDLSRHLSSRRSGKLLRNISRRQRAGRPA